MMRHSLAEASKLGGYDKTQQRVRLFLVSGMLHCPCLRRRGPLALSKVHRVRPELVAEITYLGWTDEPLRRHTVFVGLRDDKPAREVRREVASRP
jgi:ATP-dependent DNA ligase